MNIVFSFIYTYTGQIDVCNSKLVRLSTLTIRSEGQETMGQGDQVMEGKRPGTNPTKGGHRVCSV